MNRYELAFFGKSRELGAAVGTQNFAAAAMAAVGALVRHDMEWIIIYGRDERPRVLHYTVEDRMQCGFDWDIILERYESGYYRLDPFYRYWRVEGQAGLVTLDEATDYDTRDDPYMLEFLPRTGMKDDIGLMLPSLGGRALGLFMERATRFTETELARLRTVSPLLEGMQRAHDRAVLGSFAGGAAAPSEDRPMLVLDRKQRVVFMNEPWRELAKREGALKSKKRLLERAEAESLPRIREGRIAVERLGEDMPLAPEGWLFTVSQAAAAPEPLDFGPAVDSFMPEALTPRERDIVRLILGGYSSHAIGRRLGIGEGTVKNHRKRLYNKLDITTERELFSLFLAHLAHIEAHELAELAS